MEMLHRDTLYNIITVQGIRKYVCSKYVCVRVRAIQWMQPN